MKRKFIQIALVVILGLITGYNVYNSQKELSSFEFVLANVEAIASSDETLGCAGNATWVNNQYLGSATCWNGGTHKKCKPMDNVCCNPSEQTDCKGI